MNRPGIGVGVFVIHKNQLLLGMRKNATGEGTWAEPGGHVEFGETPEEACIREVKEETGIIVKDPKFVGFTNDIFEKEKKHYITLFYRVYSDSPDTQVIEPDKCEEWKWFEIDNLPEPLFLPLENLLKQDIDFSFIAH